MGSWERSRGWRAKTGSCTSDLETLPPNFVFSGKQSTPDLELLATNSVFLGKQSMPPKQEQTRREGLE